MIETDKKIKLNERLLSFKPSIPFANTIGGLQLCLEVDTFNKHFNWIVQEGDHITDFLEDFDAACEYYIKCGGHAYI